MRHLDTDIMIHLLRGNDAVAARFETCLPHVGISTLALAELRYGVLASNAPEAHAARLDDLLPAITIVPFDKRAALAYAEIRLSLRRRGRPIGDIDTLVAAVAVANEAALVTHNTRHFTEVEGLVVEDWME